MAGPCEPPTLLGHAYELIERGRRLLRCMSPVVAHIVSYCDAATCPKLGVNWK
jgi:hypothetical protein